VQTPTIVVWPGYATKGDKMADLECTLGKITPTEIVEAVNARVEENADITPGTKTKVTYDAKGLVTAGEAATTADIADSTDKRYVTDAESTVIGNTSGTNSGDKDVVDDTSPQLGGDLDFNGKTMNKSAVRQVADDSGSGTVTFDYATEDMIQYTATGNLTTLTFSNFPSGDVAGYIIDAVDWGNYTITHPGTMLFAAGTAPTYTTDGTDRILVTSDKDAILTLTIIAQDIKVVA